MTVDNSQMVLVKYLYVERQYKEPPLPPKNKFLLILKFQLKNQTLQKPIPICKDIKTK